MSFTQLNPPIPIDVIDKGHGIAVAVIDYGPEHNLIWVTAIDGTGEVWCAPNPKVRFQKNWTMGRSAPNLGGDRPTERTGGDPVPLSPVNAA